MKCKDCKNIRSAKVIGDTIQDKAGGGVERRTVHLLASYCGKHFFLVDLAVDRNCGCYEVGSNCPKCGSGLEIERQGGLSIKFCQSCGWDEQHGGE